MSFGDFIAAMEYRATNLDEYMGEHGIELTPRNKGRILLASRLGLMEY